MHAEAAAIVLDAKVASVARHVPRAAKLSRKRTRPKDNANRAGAGVKSARIVRPGKRVNHVRCANPANPVHRAPLKHNRQSRPASPPRLPQPLPPQGKRKSRKPRKINAPGEAVAAVAANAEKSAPRKSARNRIWIRSRNWPRCLLQNCRRSWRNLLQLHHPLRLLLLLQLQALHHLPHLRRQTCSLPSLWFRLPLNQSKLNSQCSCLPRCLSWLRRNRSLPFRRHAWK